MEIDWTWAQAWQITYKSIALVVIILIILVVATWLMGLIIHRMGRRGNKTEAGSEETNSTE
jgi:Na+-transporting methylmalonyl-CoA/oxaloacetate decarboxylase gamma subunit